ncbi:MAG TPA: GAF domain-containing sensor histidine kinase, partial [Armatimonadota bacterium]|nr:GAF domain-containing sensor histidine kinase [Armatimonadota bacterium]
MTDTGTPPADLTELEHHLRARERQLDAVISVTHALQQHVDLDELLQRAVTTAMATVDADAGSIILHDPERGTLVFRHVEGPSKAKITGLEIADTQGICGDVFHTGEARISHDVNRDRAHTLDVDKKSQYHTRTMITVPLQAGDRIGVLQVLNKRSGRFNAEDLAVVEVLATQVASAIITARLFQQAQAAAIVDMVGQISHDIKNLLTPISMAGDTLRMMMEDFHQQISDQLDRPHEDVCEMVPSLRVSCQQIYADVTEIFAILDESTQIAQQRAKEIADAVKGMTSAPVYEPTDLNEVVRGVCRVLAVVAAQQGITLDAATGAVPVSLLDSRRMYNAIYNLTNNALGATPCGGQVTVSTCCRAQGDFPDGRFVEVRVRDTGCGMSPEVMARATDPF